MIHQVIVVLALAACSYSLLISHPRVNQHGFPVSKMSLDKSELLATHYGDPLAGPCESEEVNITVTGVAGSVCAPPCGLLKKCPADVPTGVTAKPTCALQDSSTKKKYCALICTPGSNDDQCGTNASCKSIQSVGLCTYDDDTDTTR